jgi:V8-like Glu-specific endopeptidase
MGAWIGRRCSPFADFQLRDSIFACPVDILAQSLHHLEVRMSIATRFSVLFCATLLSVGSAAAQQTLDAPVGQMLPYAVDSGTWAATNDDFDVVYAEEVHVAEAAWIRLYFSEIALSGDSFVRITSLADGEAQALDAAGVAMWNSTSAYFNGNAVLLELVAAPGTLGNRVATAQIEVEFAHDAGTRGDPSQCGICGGVDDRAPSMQDWSCRLMSVGCTASVWTTSSCLVSAGHCISGTLVAQFRVPPSLANCNTVNPPVNDQFPITAQQSLNGGVGADWAVLRTGTNGLGQRPFQRYGQMRRIAPLPAAVGNAVEIFGYGLDLTCVRSQTQQLSTGAVTAVAASNYQFNADVRGGNSGSGLLRLGRIVAVVTHCSGGCPNFGTRTEVAAFANARNAICPACNADTNGDGVVDLGDLSRVLGNFGVCYPDPLLNPAMDINADNCVNLTDLSLVLGAFGAVCP